METRTLKDADEKEHVIDHVNDPDIHWSYDKLDARYMNRNELNYRFEVIVKNQEKMMHKLNVN